MKLLTGVQEIPVADRDGSNRVEHLSFVAKLVKMPKPTKNTVAEFFDKYGEFLETFGREYIQTKYQSKSKSDQFAYLEWVKAQAEEAENLSKKLKLANWAG
jgi:cell shape-determining protein MreC